MNCPKCMATVDQGAKFCRQCGSPLGIECPTCGAPNPPDSKYCGDCGGRMKAMKNAPPGISEPLEDDPAFGAARQGERRHVTILFTDLTGYTALSEKYDPEDIQALTVAIQSKVAAIILKYHGYLERVIGDGIMAVFGLPMSHEDDPVRAIKAAREIHQTVAGLQPFKSMDDVEPISMHTGINTGLVVTANPHPKDGAYQLSGDAVNLASRLSDMAEPGTIIVGSETYRQASGIFDFEVRPPQKVKGKTDVILAYAVVRAKDRPVTVRRKTGLQSRLVGRRLEMSQLREATTRLKQGYGSICAIIGEAGTGKSRLIDEFETEFTKEERNWITGFAYAHTQQIPYYPLLDLVRRWLNPEDIATSEDLKALIDAGALIYSQDQWQLKRAFLETDVPSTIHGVIASRLDQLSLKARRVLQEASVAGRAFLYDILKRISVYSDGVEDGLYELERSGLVHTRALHPEMEFMFKHALIQEVGYSSLLRKERQQVHERIAQVMEQLLVKWDAAGCRLRGLTCGFVMAQVYTQLLHLTDQGPSRGPTDQSAAYYQKALNRYRACIDTAQAHGATALQGRSLLELGALYLAADNPDTAQDAYQKSIVLFEQSDAGVYLQHAREKLEKLKKNHFREPVGPRKK